MGRDLRSALGRLVFVAGALHEVRPFLGPIFAWSSVMKGGTYGKMPDAMVLLLEYLRALLQGERMTVARPIARELTDVFRVDAKAEGEIVVVGGWETYGGRAIGEARWFSIKLTRRNAPWVFLKGEPFKAIASLELVAVLCSLMLFGEDAE